MDSKCHEMTVSNQLRDRLSWYFYLLLPHLTALSRSLCVMARLAFAALGRPQGTADTLRLLRKRWDGGSRGQGEGREDMKAGLGGRHSQMGRQEPLTCQGQTLSPKREPGKERGIGHGGGRCNAKGTEAGSQVQFVNRGFSQMHTHFHWLECKGTSESQLSQVSDRKTETQISGIN